ncbi:MAG: AAA family ATPase [Bacteroidetes bacterium]|nr:AAA family ATPase [Bacteroidota bacterium]
MNGTIGSVWRKWDLHVHTPASYGGNFDEFITNAKSCDADVIGINDYCTLSGYKSIMDRGGIVGKVLFPVVEFRMHNIVANRKGKDGHQLPSGPFVNFHVILDNDPLLFPKIENWLNSLPCFGKDGKSTLLGAELATANNSEILNKLTFDIEAVVRTLADLKLLDEHALIWLPYDEYGGIDDIDPNDNFFKLSLILKAHILGSGNEKQIRFFKWEHEDYSAENIRELIKVRKPCIKGSDAHSNQYPFGKLQDRNSEPSDRYCWIKADTTFNGLRQVVIEPDRVFIGVTPELLLRERAHPTKFVMSLSLSAADSHIGKRWFDDLTIDFNTSLVAIIGNKGSGKSAITDILGLCGNTHQDPEAFSFLTKNKFKRPKPENLSESYSATVRWGDGAESTAVLNQTPDRRMVERIRYIPQNFLESLCSDVDSSDFERELKQIIYSHMPVERREGKSTLDDLITYRSSVVEADILRIQTDITRINRDIIALEAKASKDHKANLENRLAVKKSELAALVKPTKPLLEETGTIDPTLTAKLETLQTQIASIEQLTSNTKKERSVAHINLSELRKVSEHFKSVDEYLHGITSQDEQHVQLLNKHGISISDVFTYSLSLDLIETAIAGYVATIADCDKLLSPTSPEDASIRSLPAQLAAAKADYQRGQEELDRPALEQQKYLNSVRAWEIQVKAIEGDTETEDTIHYLSAQLEYLSKTLPSELASKRQERDKYAGLLLDKKSLLVQIRRELFDPVSAFIASNKDLSQRYDVRVDVSLSIGRFVDDFFGFIVQNRKGTFASTNEGYKVLSDMCERVHFDEKAEVLSFANRLIDALQVNTSGGGNEIMDVGQQLKKGKSIEDIYSFIFHFDYLTPTFSLKLGSKSLQELSPGERGALLLIFYLILDKSDIPLVIDQPEENLDNESIYHLLVHFIKQIKERRQIFMVTHNPNLAIVCDADQIIHMNIDKEHDNQVSYYSASIEDQEMNSRIINILEGTLPAFDNRDSKYYR